MAEHDISIRERLGGRWAVSLRAYVISFPIGILLGLLVTPESIKSLQSFATWFLISCVGMIGAGLVLLVADKTFLRNRRIHPVAVWQVFLIDIIAIEVRTAIFIICIKIFDLPNSTPFPTRILSALILATVWFPALTYALDSWDRYKTMRDHLISQLVAERLEILNQEQVLEVLRLGLVADINTQVNQSVRDAKETLSSLRDAVAVEHSGEMALAVLSQINNESIRGLSKKLWNEQTTRSKLRFVDLIRATAYTRPFRPAVFAPPVSLLSIVLLSRQVSLQQATIVSIVWLGYVAAISTLANLACRKFKAFAFQIYIVAILFLAAAGVLSYVILGTFEIGPIPQLNWSLMAGATAALLMPWVSSGSGVTAHRQEVLSLLRGSINQAEIEGLAIARERAQLSKQISTYLHGTVQATMSAAILRLQQSIEVGDREAAAQALGDARKALELNWDPSLGMHVPDLRLALDDIAKGWLGFLDITYRIRNEIPVKYNRTIREIVLEATTNAVRHGDASVVEIDIEAREKTIHLRIRNNGHAIKNALPGIGTESLNTYAPGNWTRESLPSGTTQLEVLITL